MFSKLKSAFQVFQTSHVVTNPVAWKNGQVSAVHLAAFLTAILQLSGSFGYEIPLSHDAINGLSVFIIAVASLFNHAATVASTDKIDIRGRSKDLQRVDTASEDSEIILGGLGSLDVGRNKEALQKLSKSESGDLSSVDDFIAARARESERSS